MASNFGSNFAFSNGARNAPLSSQSLKTRNEVADHALACSTSYHLRRECPSLLLASSRGQIRVVSESGKGYIRDRRRLSMLRADRRRGNSPGVLHFIQVGTYADVNPCFGASSADMLPGLLPRTASSPTDRTINYATRKPKHMDTVLCCVSVTPVQPVVLTCSRKSWSSRGPARSSGTPPGGADPNGDKFVFILSMRKNRSDHICHREGWEKNQ